MTAGADHRDNQGMRLWCAPGVYLARVHEDIVVLDIQADRYDCLLDLADAISLGDAGAIDVTEPAIAQELVEAGIARRQPDPASRPAPIPAARQLTGGATAVWPALLNAAVPLTLAAMAFRGRSLSALLEPLRAGRHSDAPSESKLSSVVAAIRAARPWLPTEGECLKRSFELRRVLAGRGVRTEWIFGVRTWPFAAHCWLQSGDLVVGDRLERVSLYTPILRA